MTMLILGMLQGDVGLLQNSYVETVFPISFGDRAFEGITQLQYCCYIIPDVGV